TRLTESPSRDIRPAWSPDGTKIAFVSFRNNEQNIFIMNNDGLNLREITDGTMPTWSPDSKFLAYQKNNNGNREIFIIEINSGIEKQLTYNKANDIFPVWCPN
ncbi:MAG: PD40 domain-containing protein, partial [Bacteroidetes bacterium]|nr:PD40 domain-containing protein [Bacteroidota bacterium]